MHKRLLFTEINTFANTAVTSYRDTLRERKKDVKLLDQQQAIKRQNHSLLAFYSFPHPLLTTAAAAAAAAQAPASHFTFFLAFPLPLMYLGKRKCNREQLTEPTKGKLEELYSLFLSGTFLLLSLCSSFSPRRLFLLALISHCFTSLFISSSHFLLPSLHFSARLARVSMKSLLDVIVACFISFYTPCLSLFFPLLLSSFTLTRCSVNVERC